MKCSISKSKSIRIALLSSCVLFAACGKIWIRPDSTTDSQPVLGSNTLDVDNYSKTAIGTAAGATIGAVAGLAIGSTSGNAGEGFLLGTAVGAAAGAGIGNALQGQEAKLEAQEAVVRQQDSVIKRQAEEIEELRDSVIDEKYPISSFNTSSMGTRSFRKYDGNPQAKPFGLASGETGENIKGNNRARLGAGTSRVTGRERIEVSEINLTAPVASRKVQMQAPKPVQVARNTSDHLDSSISAPKPTLVGMDSRTSAVDTGNEIAHEVTTPTSSVSDSLPVAAGHSLTTKPSVGISTPEPIRVGASTKSAPKPVVSAAKKPVAKNTVAKNTVAKNTVAKKTAAVKTQIAKAKPTPTVVKKKPEVVPEKKEPAVVAKATTGAPASAALDEGCQQASEEASRGKASTSDADTLFYYRRAIRLCPSEPSYYVAVGKVYVSIGRTEDAQHEFNKALELDPENEAAQNELSMIMLGAAY